MYDILDKYIPKEIKSGSSGVKFENHELTYGFNTTTSLACESSSGSLTGTRIGHWQGNRMSLFGKYRARVDVDKGILDGINKKYLGPVYGDVVDDQVIEDYSRITNDKQAARYVANEMIARIKSKNMIAPLYNLLCLYYLLSTETEIEYNPDEVIYDDGHVQMTNKQLYGANYKYFKGKGIDHFELDSSNVEYVFGPNKPRFDDVGCKVAEEIRVACAILHFRTRLTDHDLQTIKYAFGDWKAKTPYGIAHDRAICANIIMLDQPVEKILTQGHIEFRAPLVKDLLCRLIVDHRLYADFYAAYEIFVSTFLTPIPRTAESAAWLESPVEVMLPEVDYVYGADYYNLLAGESYESDPRCEASFHAWRQTSGMAVHHSIVLNEAVYTQLAMLHNIPSEASINMGNFVNQMTNGWATNEMGILSEMTLLATAMKEDFYYPFFTMAGARKGVNFVGRHDMLVKTTIKDADAPSHYKFILNTKITKKEKIVTRKLTKKELDLIKEYVKNEDMNKLVLEEKIFVDDFESSVPGVGDNATIMVEYLPAIMYPIYLYDVGQMGINGARSEQSVELDLAPDVDGDCRVFDEDSLIKVMDIARVCGWNLKVFDENRKMFITNWADNTSGRYVHENILLNKKRTYLVRPENFVRRKNCWLSIPDIGEYIKLSYKNGSRQFHWYNGKHKVDGDERSRPLQFTGLRAAIGKHKEYSKTTVYRSIIDQKVPVIQSIIKKSVFSGIHHVEKSKDIMILPSLFETRGAVSTKDDDVIAGIAPPNLDVN